MTGLARICAPTNGQVAEAEYGLKYLAVEIALDETKALATSIPLVG